VKAVIAGGFVIERGNCLAKEPAMSRSVARAAVALLAAVLLVPSAGSAQSNPSTQDIVKSLTPSAASNGTRGIRVGPSTGGSGGPSTGGSGGPSSAPSEAHAAPAPAVSLTVQFATGSADLTPQAMQTLDRLGQALTDRSLASYRFRIEGHTDTVGSPEANKELSERRAATVVDYLSSRFRVDRSRVEPIGMGEEGLAIPTPPQTPEARNRRVQVVNIGS
jgi:OmpA-OmpF porin, OOP family